MGLPARAPPLSATLEAQAAAALGRADAAALAGAALLGVVLAALGRPLLGAWALFEGLFYVYQSWRYDGERDAARGARARTHIGRLCPLPPPAACPRRHHASHTPHRDSESVVRR